jgi:hypothetical protein
VYDGLHVKGVSRKVKRPFKKGEVSTFFFKKILVKDTLVGIEVINLSQRLLNILIIGSSIF